MTTRSRILITLAATAALALSSAAFAGPPRHGGPHHGGPHHGYHGGPHHHHHHHGGWIWGPLAAGAVIYGMAELSRPRTVIVQQPAPVVVQQPATVYQNYQGSVTRYVYWCELEQGYYPQVRACPSGWKQMPAP